MRLWILALLLTGCANAPKSDFVITREPLGPPIAGFGTCMNPYLYAPPNMPDEISEEQVKELEAKIKALRPQFVRIFFLQSWWDLDTDASIAKGRPGMRRSLIRTIRLAQESGATVLLQFWYDPNRYQDPDGVAQRFARTIAELRRDHGLASIRYATIQNEPDENPGDATWVRYVRVYRAFDRALRDEGIRQQIQIIGGDLVGEYQHRWFEKLGRELSPVLDGYSIHSYWDYWDIRKFRRHIADTSAILAKMPARQRRPIYVTEFGARGFRDRPEIEPGKAVDGRPLCDDPTYAFEIAIFMLDTINAGFVATAQWDLYDAWYDRKMGYGVIGPVERGFPFKPGYPLLQMFTHATQPGWRAMKIDGRIEDLWLAALRGPGRDQLSIFVLNRLKSERQITLSGLPPGRTFTVRRWNFKGTGEAQTATPITADAKGTITLNLPHMAVEVLSS